MTAGAMEERLVTLEARLDFLQRQVEERLMPLTPTADSGWKAIVGTFDADPLYDEAMILGREWRENQYNEAEPTP